MEVSLIAASITFLVLFVAVLALWRDVTSWEAFAIAFVGSVPLAGILYRFWVGSPRVPLKARWMIGFVGGYALGMVLLQVAFGPDITALAWGLGVGAILVLSLAGVRPPARGGPPRP